MGQALEVAAVAQAVSVVGGLVADAVLILALPGRLLSPPAALVERRSFQIHSSASRRRR